STPSQADDADDFGLLLPNVESSLMQSPIGSVSGYERKVKKVNDTPVVWSARWDSKSAQAAVLVSAQINSPWHLYSIDQPKGGPLPTKFEVSTIGGGTVALAGEIEADVAPKQKTSDVYNMQVFEHEGDVTWRIPVNVKSATQITVKVSALACESINGQCRPVRDSFTLDVASVAGSLMADSPTSDSQDLVAKDASKSELFRDDDYVVGWLGELVSSNIAPGEQTTLKFTAIPDPTFHVYEAATDASESKTNFVITDKAELKIGAPVTASEVISHQLAPSLPPVMYHEGRVEWSIPIKVPEDAKPGLHNIEGMVAYMACTENSCRRPKGFKFTASLSVGKEVNATPVKMETIKFADVLDTADETEWVDADVLPSELAQSMPPEFYLGGNSRSLDDATIAKLKEDQLSKPLPNSEDNDLATAPMIASKGGGGFGKWLVFAFLGGIILNAMPCVLPVIGLKVMSFVSQGGQDRKRIFTLNLAYAAGIAAVFALLAFLSIAFGFGWGEQFQYFSVRLGVTIALFAFALSYLEVWEIPVPGMASGGKSQELQSQEGHAGAFCKGIFTTFLATPCSGPLLGGVFAATLSMTGFQKACIFAALALGMSSPYLIIGARPELAKWLPKPGAWMNIFKQAMAFMFLGAVCYFFYQFSDENKLPVFITLIGVWFGCWLVGLVPIYADVKKRLAGWGAGIAAATAISVTAFSSLNAPATLNWVDYDELSLSRYQEDGKTVLVDFSAKWCVNCLVNLETAIDTEPTAELIEQLGVVSMYADWTNQDEHISEKLNELESNSIPLLAIYPADRPDEPIILRDLVTQSQV
ncbi:MAG: cytochrome c biogenesis protein CcdA, partial [Planctomycetota bacterium]